MNFKGFVSKLFTKKDRQDEIEVSETEGTSPEINPD